VKLRYVERMGIVTGLLFLTVWFVAQLHGIVGSRLAIERFEAEHRTRPNQEFATPGSPSGVSVDTRLWSSQRILAYQDSLTKKQDLPIAILRIPKIGLRAPIFDGTDDLTLNLGLGRIAGTAQIGETGNVGIAGHRDGFFRGLQQTRPGDIVQLERTDRTDTYVVRQIRVVTPKDTYVLGPTPVPTLTLITCFPFYFVGSAPQRYVVTASAAGGELEHFAEANSSRSTAK
jgi:sortase A